MYVRKATWALRTFKNSWEWSLDGARFLSQKCMMNKAIQHRSLFFLHAIFTGFCGITFSLKTMEFHLVYIDVPAKWILFSYSYMKKVEPSYGISFLRPIPVTFITSWKPCKLFCVFCFIFLSFWSPIEITFSYNSMKNVENNTLWKLTSCFEASLKKIINHHILLWKSKDLWHDMVCCHTRTM